MSGAEEVRFSLKLMINKEKSKVLFASVDSAFADVLLSFLTLPTGRILSVLNKHYAGDKAPAIGSLSTLYTGLQKLDGAFFWTKAGKQMLLNPRTSVEDEYLKLKVNVYGAQPTKYLTCYCTDPIFSLSQYSEDDMCFNCEEFMSERIVEEPLRTSLCSGEVFARQHASFLICDDLQMFPNETGSILQTLADFGIMDIDGVENSTVSVGFDEIMDLLKGSLISKTPLTDLFLHKREAHHSAIEKPELATLLPPRRNEEATECTSKKMKVKITTQRSQSKVLFAQAEDDFVDFLFSLLTIPLGQVETILGINSSLGCIDNLYRSVASFDGHKWLTNQAKDLLLEPKLPRGYLSKHQILSLAEQADLYCYTDNISDELIFSHRGKSCDKVFFVDPKGQGHSYVKSNSMLLVADDLTVTPLCLLSSLSFLKSRGVPLSDIEELEINIGLEEALNILKASLTSTSALTDGLKLRTALWKQPKQENH